MVIRILIIIDQQYVIMVFKLRLFGNWAGAVKLSLFTESTLHVQPLLLKHPCIHDWVRARWRKPHYQMIVTNSNLSTTLLSHNRDCVFLYKMALFLEIPWFPMKPLKGRGTEINRNVIKSMHEELLLISQASFSSRACLYWGFYII